MNYQDAKNILEKHGQGHVLKFWECLNAPQQASLVSQIEALDFKTIARIQELLKAGGESTGLALTWGDHQCGSPMGGGEHERCRIGGWRDANDADARLEQVRFVEAECSDVRRRHATPCSRGHRCVATG